MMIDTGKIASNSFSVLKRIKDNETNLKISKNDQTIHQDITNKIKQDFSDIKLNDKSIKTRLVNLNNQLNDHETEVSQTQYTDQKIKLIESLLAKNDLKQANDVIENSLFNNQKILKEFFKTDEDLQEQVTRAKKVIESRFSELNKEFKTIEVSSQNMVSLFSYSDNLSSESFKNLNLDKIIESSIKLNNKRVMDLIS
jgi:hypothetical protein